MAWSNTLKYYSNIQNEGLKEGGWSLGEKKVGTGGDVLCGVRIMCTRNRQYQNSKSQNFNL